ncbi:MAG: hypothetical protein F4Y69_02100 [Chloroflexi bacterium]|nr:hypothetical protein [Chloroflexota bacterium]MYF22254.1 hypothetical protein [Chloroflexota bacterium]
MGPELNPVPSPCFTQGPARLQAPSPHFPLSPRSATDFGCKTEEYPAMDPIHVCALSDTEFEAQYKELAIQCGDKRIVAAGERKHLRSVLMGDELLLWMASGLYSGAENVSWNLGASLITLTDRRLLILKKGVFRGIQAVAIDLDKVSVIAGDVGLLFGNIRIQVGANEHKIEQVSKQTVNVFVQQVEYAIEARKLDARTPLADEWEQGSELVPPTELTLPTASQSVDVIGQLERLADLRERGMLTDEEFEDQKRRVLRGD